MTTGLTIRTIRPEGVEKAVIQKIDNSGWNIFRIKTLTQSSRNRLARIVKEARQGKWYLYTSPNYYVIAKQGLDKAAETGA